MIGIGKRLKRRELAIFLFATVLYSSSQIRIQVSFKISHQSQSALVMPLAYCTQASSGFVAYVPVDKLIM